VFSGPLVSAITGLLPDLTTIGVSVLALSALLYGFHIIGDMIYKTHNGGRSYLESRVDYEVEGWEGWEETTTHEVGLTPDGEPMYDDGELI
jgi:hypothetical protein